jgi:hypothetical protein
MEKVNLLDLNNDVLNVIGDYVKKDNMDRITTNYNEREDEKTKKIIFKYVSSQLKEIKKICKDKLMIIKFIDMYFHKCGIFDNHPYIEEYLKLKNLQN